MARLIRLDTKETYKLAAGVTTIGRRATNTIHLDDRHVSRGHCRIEGPKGGWTLYDSGSATGTLVNGRQVHEHRLKPGDRIQIGSVLLRFEIPKPEPPVPGARPLSNGAAQKLLPRDVIGRGLVARLCRSRVGLVIFLAVLAAAAIAALAALLAGAR